MLNAGSSNSITLTHFTQTASPCRDLLQPTFRKGKIFSLEIHSAPFLEIKRKSIRANQVRNQKTTEMTSKHRKYIIFLVPQLIIETDYGQSASKMNASSPMLLRHLAKPGTSTIQPKNQAIGLPTGSPLSNFTGPAEVLYECCECGHGPWSWNRIPHCQLCGHRQCRYCRYRTVRGYAT